MVSICLIGGLSVVAVRLVLIVAIVVNKHDWWHSLAHTHAHCSQIGHVPPEHLVLVSERLQVASHLVHALLELIDLMHRGERFEANVRELCLRRVQLLLQIVYQALV